MWSNSKYSPIKKKFKFPPPLNGEVELEARRPPVLEAVVSSLHTLFQQDLQQVIKSKYRERVLLWDTLQLPVLGLTRQVLLTYAMFYKES